MDYQWYPGHMTKARRKMSDDLRLVDLVIELTDARAPQSGRNPDIDELGEKKARVILLNKADLADESQNGLWADWYCARGYQAAAVDSRKGAGLKQVQDLILAACKDKIERDRRRGIRNRPLRAMVAGIPNVGKSTFINSFAGKACAKTGNRPGVTRGEQWIRLNRKVELLDTPGILWPKIEDPAVGIKLAVLGTIKDEILQTEELALWLISFLQEKYPGRLSARYQVPEEGSASDLLEQIAKARGCLKHGALPDTKRAASIVTDDFRGGRMGRITLEFAGEQQETSDRKKRDRK